MEEEDIARNTVAVAYAGEPAYLMSLADFETTGDHVVSWSRYSE